MKFNKILGTLSAVAVLGSVVSCSDSYLDTEPETTIGTNEVTRTVEAAKLAINGICNAMQTQYQNTEYNQYNGESYLNTLLNEGLGQDDLSGLSLSMWGDEIVTGGAPWGKDNYVLNWMAWAYCYNIIQQANQVLDGIDEASGSAAERDFVKAQALTFRAHGYTKLMQYYAPRWENSRNGEYRAAVYRVKAGVEDAPLCTMKEVFDLIYSDLNTAIALYKSGAEGGAKREFKWQPDLNVAYGIFARAAMIIHDFPKAQEMAHNARQGYSVMDNNTYLSGFCYDNDEFMWIQASEPANIYYWSWGAHHAVNGIYVKNWGEGAGAIDYEFYKTLDERDIRRKCFFTPDKIDVLVAVKRSYNPGKLTEADFWEPSLVNASKNCDLSVGAYAKTGAGKDGKWGMYNLAIRYAWYYGNNIFTGDYASMVNQGFYAYYSVGNDGKLALTATESGTLVPMPFGAQFKFWSVPPYGVSAYPFMRASEMILTEAEAACHNNDEPTAIKCLKEINDMRIPGYTVTATGADLLEEVIKTRRIELWGEGFSWPDFKRWNRDIVRKPWIANDPENGIVGSGNWMPDYGKDTPASANNGWRMLIPKSEYEYNKAIDRNLLEK